MDESMKEGQLDKKGIIKKIEEKLSLPSEQLNLENSEVIKWAEDFYNTRVRNFKYYFFTFKLKPFYLIPYFAWLWAIRVWLGLTRIFVIFIGFFGFLPPGIRNWEFFGLAENIKYRTDILPSDVYKSYEKYARFDLEKELPILVYKSWDEGFLITNKYLYFNFMPSKKLKNIFKEKKAGKIELSKIHSVDIKGGTAAAEVRINGELIGGYEVDCSQDSSILRDFLDGLPK